MRFHIQKEPFLKALLTVGRAAAVKSAVPALANIKIDLNEKGLELTGSNGEMTINVITPYQIGETRIIREANEGKTLVNARYITETIRRMDGEDISFEVIDNAMVKIDDGRSSFKLFCANAEEYPDLNLEESGHVFEARVSDFADLVEQSFFAASTKEQKPVLSAVHLETENEGELTGTATDSARLARKTISITGDARFSANVPARILSDVVRLFENEDVVRIAIDDKKALFHFGNTLVSTRLIAGDYPVTKSIVPSGFNYFLEVNAQELMSAMGRLSIFSAEKDCGVKLSMSDDAVEVYGKSEATGSGHEKIQTYNFVGEPLEVSFNPAFMIDAIKALHAEEVTLCFVGEMKPFVVKNPKDPSVVEIVTPMRTY
ncbi:MAG: DNA polymerase III subunit beta [Candidatus Enteromonas sp.]